MIPTEAFRSVSLVESILLWAERLSVIVCFKAPANDVSGTPDRSLSVLSIQVNAFQRKRVVPL